MKCDFTVVLETRIFKCEARYRPKFSRTARSVSSDHLGGGGLTTVPLFKLTQRGYASIDLLSLIAQSITDDFSRFNWILDA